MIQVSIYVAALSFVKLSPKQAIFGLFLSWGNLCCLIFFTMFVLEYSPTLLVEHLKEHHFMHMFPPMGFLLFIIWHRPRLSSFFDVFQPPPFYYFNFLILISIYCIFSLGELNLNTRYQINLPRSLQFCIPILASSQNLLLQYLISKRTPWKSGGKHSPSEEQLEVELGLLVKDLV